MPNPIPFIIAQFVTPPKPNVDLTGQTILVTGGNAGLGLEAAKWLVQLNCSNVIITCRTDEKGEKAKKDVLNHARDNGKDQVKVSYFLLEMTSFQDVAAFAEQAKSLPRLDGVILNAGVDLLEFTLAEGYETTITVNVISTFLLATLLVPTLRSTAIQYKVQPRIAVVGSLVHYFCNTKDLTDPAEGQILHSISDPKKADMKARYFLSKLPVMMMVQHMAEILTQSAQKSPQTKPLVIINNVAPGLCNTSLFRNEPSAANRMFARVAGRTAEVGGRTLVHGVAAGEETHGQYLSECQIKQASPFVRGPEGRENAERIWKELAAIYERVKPGCTSEL